MTNDGANPPKADSTVELAPGVRIVRGDLRFTFTRAAGPGGQSVNKLSTAAQLRVSVRAIGGLDAGAADRLRRLAGRRLTRDDDIILRARAHRSQLDNRRACLDRLRALVVEALTVPKKRKAAKPSRSMIERRLKAKRQIAEKKQRRRFDEEG